MAQKGQNVEIKCGFSITLEDMQCHYITLLQADSDNPKGIRRVVLRILISYLPYVLVTTS